MVTVIAIDLSLSMLRDVKNEDANDSFTPLQLATHGVNVLMDYLAINSKFEYVAVVTFSSTCDVLCPFTRDYDLIKSKVTELEFRTNTCYPNVIQTINNLVCSEWSNTITCHVIMLTDGNCYEGLRKPDITQFLFPGKLIVVSLEQVSEISFYKNYASNNLPNNLGYIKSFDVPPSPSLVTKVIEEIAKKIYVPFSAVLECGNLKSDINLFPPPMPFIKATDFEIINCSISSPICILGFLESSKVGCPAIRSRHFIIAQEISDECTENNKTSSKDPSFCVLLYKSLKVENMTALCELNSNWYGLLVSWTDKSNLTLLILEPGKNPIPWLGNIQNLTLSPTEINKPQINNLRPTKMSYNQSRIVSIKQESLQVDINKMLRKARKMPHKISNFYKELNRIRFAAIAYSFNDLLTGIADLLDTELKNLPAGTHPDCGIQMIHAAMELRKPYALDPKHEIIPIYSNNNAHF